MIIRSIELKNFRNFKHKKLEFGEGVNVVFGLNGQGKTNILEAISVSCLSKSFRTRTDLDMVQFNEDYFQDIAEIVLDNELEKKIRVDYNKSSGKSISIDQNKIKSVVELFGSFPVVILSPEDDIVTNGPPKERRRFLNFILSQLDKEYLKSLQHYDRTLKQRNRILLEAQENRYQFSTKIEPWNQKLYDLSKTITQKRIKFLKKLQEVVQPIHKELTVYMEDFTIDYHPSFQLDWDSFDDFKQYLDQHTNEEIMKGNTIIGPHRDNIQFLIDENDLRRFGSRGQHRSLLLALKIGVYKIILEKKKEHPVFLLDDVYSEIDRVREKAFNDYFLDLKQVFITTHEKDVEFDLPDKFNKEIKYTHIENNSFEQNWMNE